MVLNKIPTFDEVKNWVNSNTVTSVNGKTGDVSVSQPITSQNSAETFSEQPVTVSLTSTEVNSESIRLLNTPKYIDFPNDTTTNSSTVSGQQYGVAVIPQTDLSGLKIKTSSDTATYCKPKIKTSNGTVIAEGTEKYANKDVFSLSASLNAGSKYYAVIELTEDGGKVGSSRDTSFPYSTGRLELTAGYYRDSEATNNWGVGGVSPLNPPTQGSAHIEWSSPTDIYEWDIATFQRTLDSETVEVYIEESTDGGTTWTESQGPISRGDPIQAAPNSRVRFRVELARSDTSNNPALDSIYRRWVV